MKTKLFLSTITLLLSFSVQALTPSKVYDYCLFNILPQVEAMLLKGGKELPSFEYPTEVNPYIKPNDVYVIMRENYLLLQKKASLKSINFKPAKTIHPSDVIEYAQQIAVVLKEKFKGKRLNSTTKSEYKKWKKKYRSGGQQIVPSDVFYLFVYMRYSIMS